MLNTTFARSFLLCSAIALCLGAGAQTPPPRSLPTPRPAPTVQPSRPQAATPAPRPAPSNGNIIIQGGDPEAMGDSEELVDMDFKDEPLINVIQQLAPFIGKTFDLDPAVQQTPVTIISHNKIPRDLAYPFLESILYSRGFSLFKDIDGHLIKIMQSTNPLGGPKEPLIIGLDEIPGDYDTLSTHIVHIKYASAEDISQAVQSIGSEGTKVDVYAPTNMLLLSDTADALQRIRAFLELVDVPGLGTRTELFFLEYTRAEVLAEQLEKVLLGDDGAPANPAAIRQTTITPVRTTRPTAVTGAPSQVFGSTKETLRLMPDERLNALIVVASEGIMEEVRGLVKQLDMPIPPEEHNLHIYELLNADAEKVQEALSEILSGTSPRKTAAAGGGGAAAAPAALSGETHAFEGKVTVTRYEQTNSLLVIASPQDYKVLESFIARLDVPQRQVYVTGVVMDVTMTNEFSVAVEAAGLGGNTGFGMTNTSDLSSIGAALLGTADTANSIVSGAPSLTASILGLGASNGLTAGIFDDLEFTINGRKTKIPFVPVLMSALERITDLEVLSQPSIVTVDNEEASFAVGQDVPFITSTGSTPRDSTGSVQTGFYGGFTRVERQDVGVKMKVTPQITEGDNVLLEIEIEVSEVAGDSVGSVDLVGPTTNKSLVTNKVLVKDGATAVLAGLIRNTADRSKTQPPIFGDIPGLGWLFRRKSDSFRKRNMVILVTPHIIKEGVDLERATDAAVLQYHETNIEQLIEQSFIRKVTGKHDERKNYRPTYDQAEALTGQRSDSRFGRGDIKR